MKDIVNEFKMDLEKLLDDMYQNLDTLVCDTLVTMSFYNEDGDANYEKLQAVMIEVLQEQFSKLSDEEEA